MHEGIFPEIDITISNSNFEHVNAEVENVYGVTMEVLAREDPMEAFSVIQAIFKELESGFPGNILPADVTIWVWRSTCTRRGLDFGKNRKYKALDFHVE